jgi:hypothetical protein
VLEVRQVRSPGGITRHVHGHGTKIPANPDRVDADGIDWEDVGDLNVKHDPIKRVAAIKGIEFRQ